MAKEKKKTIIITVILAVVALALIAVFTVITLKENGVIASSEAKEELKEFYEAFNSKERTIIYYASPSCSYCTLQTPILETIAEDYDLDYYYLDASTLALKQRTEVLDKLGIEHATPTTVVVENGEVIDVARGYTQGKDYVEFLIDTEVLPEDAEYSAEKYITFIDYDKYEDLIDDSGIHAIVIGQTTCSHCIAFKPTMNTVAKDYDVTINYLDLTEMSEDESNDFFAGLKTIGYNDPDFLEDGSFGTPTTLIVEDGKVVDYISGQRTISQLVREFKKLGLISE
ncbi:MAG: thioredoxin family protein [Bacilli bacterium]|nr:thioredoxin family protein [Bacilli bacterium]